MRLTIEQKAEIARLKRSGVGYRTIANKMGLKPSTVSSFCQRSGLFADNPAHKVLFTIPEARFSNVPALTKALPPQKVITGHKQTDAYLWVLEVIKLNEPAHLDAAEAALEKLTISPKDVEKRYRDWMVANGADILQTAFGTFSMNDPQHYLKLARENISNCLEGKNYGATWWYDSSHSSFFLSIAFRMVSSLRIQATSATFLAFPAASRRT